jgi:transcription termination factor Rho
VSADTQQLERSALERKDRDELHTIAVALGGKPTSRARKAEIVDLILELAGVPAAAPAASAPAAPPASDGSAESAPASGDGAPTEASDGRRRGADRTGARRGRGPAVDDPAPADEKDQEPTAPSTGRSTARSSQDRTGAADTRADDGEAETADAAPAADVTDADADTDTPGEGANAAGGQPQSQGTGQGQAGPDGESGNRRRRRRGRDRNDRDRAPQGERAPDGEQPFQGEPVEVDGLLDLRDEGYGFLRLAGYLPSKDDVYISVKQVRQFALRKGDQVTGAARPAGRNEKNPAMLRIDAVNGVDPEVARQRPRFEDLTPLFPDERLPLEVTGEAHNMTTRIIDLVAPIGKGQRGLIVSPPKAGKTTVMKQIARSIELNNPDVHLIVLLVDERPEEVTDMRRWVKGEVAASTFDRPADEHTMVAELTIERAKRMVEDGRDVVIILDGITRLARAYNLAAPATGRIMSGGIDTGALYPPKKFFGAARNIEEGGSLTILATALVETGSKMDEVIFEEFKGTGNMELRLDRRLAERRIYPAIDVDASSTRHEELLFTPKELQMVWKLRRVLSGLSERGSGAGLEMLIDRLASFKSNEQFLAEVGKAPANP